jgi:hypothetical protein
MRLALMSLLMIPLVVGCSNTDKTRLYDCTGPNNETYDVFNCEEDVTPIYVGIEEEWTGDMCDGVDSITLRSSSCNLAGDLRGSEVGQVDISPCGGPIGTEHQIFVRMNPIYKEEVDRASVRISSDGHGEQECMMTRDPADRGLHTLILTSEGATDEVRNDIIQFMLWKSD